MANSSNSNSIASSNYTNYMVRITPFEDFFLGQDLRAAIDDDIRTLLMRYNLSGLLHLLDIPVNDNLLKAAAVFWRPERRVFQFGNVEVTPLYEEFCSILQYSPTYSWSIQRGNSFTLMNRVPQLFPHMTRALTKMWLDEENRAIKLDELIRCYFPDGPALLSEHSEEKKEAWVFVLVASLLYATGENLTSKLFFDMFNAMKRREGCVVMSSLALTHIGLSHWLHNADRVLKGSPILLQIWLCERLMLITPPEVPPQAYVLPMLRRRRMIHGHNSHFEWVDFLKGIHSERVHWDVAWWEIQSFAYSTNTTHFLPIASYDYASSYTPARVRRQMGLAPIGQVSGDVFEMGRVTTPGATFCRRVWEKITFVPRGGGGNLDIYRPSMEYQVWFNTLVYGVMEDELLKEVKDFEDSQIELRRYKLAP